MIRPNIVLIMADQWRRDCLGVMGHPVVETPTLDMMKRKGYLFEKAYSAVPSCIAARAAVLTGLSQGSHGRVGYQDGIPWNYPVMLAGEFAKAGYHTQCVGKMHVYPERNLCGFHNVILHDGYLHYARRQGEKGSQPQEKTDDYLHWLRQRRGADCDLLGSGLSCNSWVARPSLLPEEEHPTNWCASQSIDFLRRRDPSKPFFLLSSFVRPHSPLDPPEYYFNLYNDRLGELPDPPLGDWAMKGDAEALGLDIDAKEGIIPKAALKRAQAAYYGHITHIDHQLNRMLMAFSENGLLESTIFLFVSDHGDLLGDHHLFRKALPYEGSSGVPFLLYDPGKLLGERQNRHFSQVIELRDILPTLLDAAGLSVPESVEGQSVLPLLQGEDALWREYLHGEHSFDMKSNHFIVTERDKYVWFSRTGEEQYFDLQKDPQELHNAIGDAGCQERIARLRGWLANELEGREEGFVADGKLCTVGSTKDVLDLLTGTK